MPIGASDVPGNQPTVGELSAEVERLREDLRYNANFLAQAQAEVERLRKANEWMGEQIDFLKAEVERLRETNQHMRLEVAEMMQREARLDGGPDA